MQRNWIGKSEGLAFEFGVKDAPAGFERLPVFTTRPDTMRGPTFAAIAPDHPLARKLAESDPKIVEFIELCQQTGTSPGNGDRDTGEGRKARLRRRAEGHAPGRPDGGNCRSTSPELRVDGLWHRRHHLQAALRTISATSISPADMALPVIDVYVPADSDERVADVAYVPPKNQTVRYVQWFGEPGLMTIYEAMKQTLALFEKNGWGKAQTQYRLRDWGISRQRYWGCPIPVIHCGKCGTNPVPVADLPVKLPDEIDVSKPGNALDHDPTSKQLSCPLCGCPALRETDTMDTFVDSSWYFARFTTPERGRSYDASDRQQMAACGPIYRRRRARDPTPALFALLRPRDEKDRPSGHGRALPRPLHPGNGDPRNV